MQITKRDLLTIAVLSIVFLAMATYNLGYTQTPTSTVTFNSGQSFYLELGTSSNVNSIYFLLEDGSYNLTIYSGSPGNWQMITSGNTFSDYYKWNNVGIDQFTQYIKVDFDQSTSNAIIAEVAVTNSNNQLLTITNITSVVQTNANLHNLIDEQSEVHLPATFMSQTYFDEIYFVKTAQQYLHLQSPYEWTHPPLGKLIQATGIAVFGFSPFGWRFMGVIFATLMITVMYLLGKRLFGTWIGAFASAFLLTFNFMHFTMARMGTADTYLVFFALLSQLFFFIYFSNVIKKGWNTSLAPLFLAVIFFFLGFSTKWIMLWSALGMLALLVTLRIRDVSRLKQSISRKYLALFERPFLPLLGFIALGIGIYFLIYIPDMLTGRPFITFPLTGPNDPGIAVVNLQFKMYEYHANLVATHPFSSAWWSWPFMISPHGYVPLWLDITYLPHNIDSTISVMGNPALWWIGFAALLVVTEQAIQGRELAKELKKRLFKKNATLETPHKAPEFLDSSGEPIKETASTALPQSLENTGESTQRSRRKRDIAAVFIAVVFFFSWIPYMLITRVTFIYHFYISAPFLCLASAYLINKYWNTRAGKVATIAFFVSVVALFAVFYPVISGAPTSISYIHELKWFPSWFFAP